MNRFAKRCRLIDNMQGKIKALVLPDWDFKNWPSSMRTVWLVVQAHTAHTGMDHVSGASISIPGIEVSNRRNRSGVAVVETPVSGGCLPQQVLHGHSSGLSRDRPPAKTALLVF